MVCSSTICTTFNVQIGAGHHLKGFGLASLPGACSGFMLPRLKTTNIAKIVIAFLLLHPVISVQDSMY
jgi:hypothetical protein